MRIKRENRAIGMQTGSILPAQTTLRAESRVCNRMPMSKTIASKYFVNDNKYYRPGNHQL